MQQLMLAVATVNSPNDILQGALDIRFVCSLRLDFISLSDGDVIQR